jgi:hypothetical protein
MSLREFSNSRVTLRSPERGNKDGDGQPKPSGVMAGSAVARNSWEMMSARWVLDEVSLE